MLHNLLAAFDNRKSVEEIAVIDFLAFFRNLILEETANHKLVQGLAEASRAGKQSHFRLVFD